MPEATSNVMGDIQHILLLLAEDPLKAADTIDALADRLKEQAAAVRRAVAQGEGQQPSIGGMGDRVIVNVLRNGS